MTQQIFDLIMGLGGLTIGGVSIGTIIVVAIRCISAIKIKKHSKLSESDKKEIAKMASDMTLEALKDGIVVDVDGQIDKATNKRISIVENKINAFADSLNSTNEILKAEGNVLCELKTPSLGAREHLQELLDNAPKAIESIPQLEQPVLQVKQAKKENIGDIKVSSVTY